MSSLPTYLPYLHTYVPTVPTLHTDRTSYLLVFLPSYSPINLLMTYTYSINLPNFIPTYLPTYLPMKYLQYLPTLLSYVPT